MPIPARRETGGGCSGHVDPRWNPAKEPSETRSRPPPRPRGGITWAAQPARSHHEPVPSAGRLWGGRSKHLKLTRHIRKDASISGREIVAVINERVGATDPDETEASVTLADGTTHKAVRVARQAVKDWEALIKSWGLQ